ncbi:MAG: phosphoribosylamine--glycine ligase [Endomicrobium sp.]|jgi:phosphoribosylamine--glycine ligase|nr:phosphoribosylamine--glycine ligase [Endomicrobium sp.]
MEVLVMGSGGREHAICQQFLKSSKIGKLYCAPGNGGTSQIATNVSISVNEASNFNKLVDFVKENRVDFTFVGPEIPLSLGVVDYFEANGLKIVGPSKNGARLESSKIYSKEFMRKYGVPTAKYNCFSDVNDVLKFLDSCEKSQKIVLKADGLAAGKGVYICSSREEAKDVVNQIMNYRILGSAGVNIIIEEYIEGPELSCLVFTDGISYSIMPASQDHKRVNDNDQGPNTGGMGAYAPASLTMLNDYDLSKRIEVIIHKIINGMKNEGIDYKGVLYVGLIIKDFSPYVLEFNCRFGDPETQAILPLLDTDLTDICVAILNKKLGALKINWKKGFSVSVVLASSGYPGRFETGFEISGLENINTEDTMIFHAGTKFETGKFFTCGGRVLSITSRADNVRAAINKVYSSVRNIYFKNMHYRKDIAWMALNE